MTHQAEPWRVESGVNYRGAPDEEVWAAIYSGKSLILYDSAQLPSGQQIPKDFERIVACINFCRGAPTELLTKLTAEAGDVIPLEYHIKTSIAEWMMRTTPGPHDFVNPKLLSPKREEDKGTHE